MVEDQEQWSRDIKLRTSARKLGVLVLQTDVYSNVPEIRDLVDTVLYLTHPSKGRG